MDFNFQNSQIQQQNIAASEQGAATATGNYAIPPEHQAAIDETARKIEPELQKPSPSIATILSDLTTLALSNAPAFLSMIKMWLFRK